MKITFEINGANRSIEISETSYTWALRYTLDPCEHAASMFEHWAQMAQQTHVGKSLEEVPTVKDANQAAAKMQAEAAEAARKTQELAMVQEADRAAVLARQQAQEQDALNKAAAEKMQAALEARAKELALAMMQTLAAEKIVKTNDPISSSLK
jgi:hypothetical protein